MVFAEARAGAAQALALGPCALSPRRPTSTTNDLEVTEAVEETLQAGPRFQIGRLALSDAPNAFPLVGRSPSRWTGRTLRSRVSESNFAGRSQVRVLSEELEKRRKRGALERACPSRRYPCP